MKKIAIITSGYLPMPDVKGGAVETLLEYTLEYNEEKNLMKFDVFSIYDNDALKKSTNFKNTNFNYIKINFLFEIFFKFIFKVLRKFKINKDPNFKFMFIRKVYKQLKNNLYDYIIVENENHFVDYLINKKIDSKIILYLHNDKLNKNTKNAHFILRNIYKVFCVSDFIKKQVEAIDKSFSNKVIVIFNGIKFKDDNSVLPHEYPNFLYTGRIEREKGVLELIKAFNMLNNKHSKLFIAGGTFYSSNNLTKYSKLVLNEAKKNDNIIFLGYINHCEIHKLYENIDAQIVPSIWQEPSGLVNMEALAYGVNLITTDVGGTREVISKVSPNKGIFLIKNNENIVKNIYVAMKNIKVLKRKYKRDMSYLTSEEYCKRYFENLEKLEVNLK